MDYIFDNLSLAKDRLVTNSIKSFEGMTTQRWLRLVAIIGGYMLLRPWLLKFAADRQKKQFEKEADELGLGASSGPTANDLRGGGKGKKSAEVKGEVKGEGKVLGEVKDTAGAPKTPRVTKRKGKGKKMLEEEEADEEREIRQFLDEQRSGLAE